MKWGALSLLTSSLLLVAVGARAHHSQNAFYKLDETVEVTGVVKSFALRNPHPEIVMEVTGDDGETVEMRVYAEAAAGMMRQGGWTEDSVTEGQTVTVVGNLARSEERKRRRRDVGWLASSPECI